MIPGGAGAPLFEANAGQCGWSGGTPPHPSRHPKPDGLLVFWSFVFSHKERIEQAKANWAASLFALPPDDNQK